MKLMNMKIIVIIISLIISINIGFSQEPNNFNFGASFGYSYVRFATHTMTLSDIMETTYCPQYGINAAYTFLSTDLVKNSIHFESKYLTAKIDKSTVKMDFTRYMEDPEDRNNKIKYRDLETANREIDIQTISLSLSYEIKFDYKFAFGFRLGQGLILPLKFTADFNRNNKLFMEDISIHDTTYTYLLVEEKDKKNVNFTTFISTFFNIPLYDKLSLQTVAGLWLSHEPIAFYKKDEWYMFSYYISCGLQYKLF